MSFLQKHAAKGQVVTGLLYVDPRRRGPARPPQHGGRAAQRARGEGPVPGHRGAGKDQRQPALSVIRALVRATRRFTAGLTGPRAPEPLDDLLPLEPLADEHAADRSDCCRCPSAADRPGWRSFTRSLKVGDRRRLIRRGRRLASAPRPAGCSPNKAHGSGGGISVLLPRGISDRGGRQRCRRLLRRVGRSHATADGSLA